MSPSSNYSHHATSKTTESSQRRRKMFRLPDVWSILLKSWFGELLGHWGWVSCMLLATMLKSTKSTTRRRSWPSLLCLQWKRGKLQAVFSSAKWCLSLLEPFSCKTVQHRIQPKPVRLGVKIICQGSGRRWSGQATVQTWIQLKISGESWRRGSTVCLLVVIERAWFRRSNLYGQS